MTDAQLLADCDRAIAAGQTFIIVKVGCRARDASRVPGWNKRLVGRFAGRVVGTVTDGYCGLVVEANAVGLAKAIRGRQ